MRRIAAILALGATVGRAGRSSAPPPAARRAPTRSARSSTTAGFLVVGEEVRIAGAKVGRISEVDVTSADEAANADGSPEPGKAVVVLEIDDPAFQDFREDASCFIRPQSLLGEKFVECRPTEPRAAGTEPPPELEEIPEGEPGEGQHLLPLENNGKAVDIDLVNNIMREPYPDRFRLILNDLGAGARRARRRPRRRDRARANPALKRTDEVLAILREAEQGARAPGPRRRPGRCSRSPRSASTSATSSTSAAVTAVGHRRAPRRPRGAVPEAPGLPARAAGDDDRARRLQPRPRRPVLSDLSDAAPDLTRINTALGPFADAGTVSLKSLGNAAEEAGPDLVASQPVLKDIERARQQPRPGRDEPREAPREPPRARRLQEPDPPDLQPRRRDQRLRLLRALPAGGAPGQQLRRLRDRLARGGVHVVLRGPAATSAKNPATDTLAQAAVRSRRRRPEPKSVRKAGSGPRRDPGGARGPVPRRRVGEPEPEPDPEPDPRARAG